MTTVGADSGRGVIAKRGEKSGVQEVELWRFDQTLELICVPPLQQADQEQTIQHIRVLLNRQIVGRRSGSTATVNIHVVSC
jgi:hypothetical protein